jgi:hypothetical protein
VTELKEDQEAEAEADAAAKSLNAVDILLASATTVDINEAAHSDRKSWFAKSMVTLTESQAANASGPVQGCAWGLQDNGVQKRVMIDLDKAHPLPSGQVVYCLAGGLRGAKRDSALRDRLLRFGVAEAELNNVNFYSVPLSTPNAFSSVSPSGQAAIVVYEGLVQGMRQQGLDVESALAGILAHELGHIQEHRRNNFESMRTTYERLRGACLSKSSADASASLPREKKIEACRNGFPTNSRQAEYTADQYAVEVIARKKYTAGLRPTELGKFFRLQSNTQRDMSDAHPDALERGIQFDRNLEKAGINLMTGGMISTNHQEMTNPSP